MNLEPESATSAEKFVVRLPRGMRKAIAESARRNRRSMNSEIVAIIGRTLGEGALPLHAGDSDPQFTTMLSHIELELLDRYRSLPEQRKRAWKEILL